MQSCVIKMKIKSKENAPLLGSYNAVISPHEISTVETWEIF